MSASRLNFSVGSPVDPTQALQVSLGNMGKYFADYQDRELRREEKEARETEDRRRYETQLARYDRQEQESLRRYEEGKELNRLEREEVRKRYEKADARQEAADKRAEKDQLWQDSERSRLEKERNEANKLSTGVLDLVGKAKQDADALARDQVLGRYMYEAKKEAAAKGKSLTSGEFQRVGIEAQDSGGNRIDSEVTWNGATGNYEKEGIPVTAKLPVIEADQDMRGISYIPLSEEQAFRTGLEAAAGRVGQADILKDPSFKRGITQELQSMGITPTAERVNAIAAEAVGGRLSDAQVDEREKLYFTQQARVAALSSGKEEGRDLDNNIVTTGSRRVGSSRPRSIGEQRAGLGNDMLSAVKLVFGQTSDNNTFIHSDGTNMVQSMKDVVKFASDPTKDVNPLIAKAAFQEMVTDAFIAGEPKGSMSTGKRLGEFKRVYDKIRGQVAAGEHTIEDSDRYIELGNLKNAMTTRYGSSGEMVRKLLQETAAPEGSDQEAPLATGRNGATGSAGTRLPTTDAAARTSPAQLRLSPMDVESMPDKIKAIPALVGMNSALIRMGVSPDKALALLENAAGTNDYSKIQAALSGRLTPQE